MTSLIKNKLDVDDKELLTAEHLTNKQILISARFNFNLISIVTFIRGDSGLGIVSLANLFSLNNDLRFNLLYKFRALCPLLVSSCKRLLWLLLSLE